MLIGMVLILIQFIERSTDRLDVMELPNVDLTTNGQLAALYGHPHWLHEIAKMGVEHSAVIAQDDQFAGLVGRHQYRGTELRE